jgi:two-component system sensor histidine kinase UhpB
MDRSPLLPDARRNRFARTDLAWVALWTAGCFALSSVLQLQEHLAAFAARFEAWQLDELPLALVALSLGLAWYAWRRRSEAARLLDHNRELAHRLITVQEGERVALARELHDELGQHCTAIRFEAAYIQRSQDIARIRESASRASASAEQLYQGVRRLLRQLRPAELDELGLLSALQALCGTWQTRTGVSCALLHEGRLDALGEATDTALYRVTQEALSNVMRHAGATRVLIEVAASPQGVALCIEDDGRGFAACTHTHGLGLLGAAERAAALGGRFEATSTPGAGTRILMCLPHRAEAAS